ncbi:MULTISPECIES: nucleoid occlusion factor SlmA [Pseudoalteromonas]|uniref:Nucleoid occlusion factor SlmA n=2 Tax=Pseudoalteromonas TaxID=53246 RepID=A0A0F4QPT0_9GAMM|nr:MULTISPECIES: nucleoid occlusion factor SlmA [Pseudoalteromonas]ALU43279.1 TetR family transcriptional regulator [Pseudoalteromonas rubra]KAF7788360.1 TetR/AcrR family transcriptional regulator [Pseudoalteromonas rubra]KJZ09339.1 TetR family transcriptional regulator [Pseudoalteromonas rubra]KNC67681.1 TetR family transcriptional regulator [Pseudoalteromonas rubra]MCF2908779.1 nucleoid occlusion factor SlmA [Pseudoalteromonas sp. DL2-H2.2]
MPATKRSNRKEQILQSLAQMLETSPGQRITTAKLATEVGVSEAALYRHFPSKARMFEGLIEFIEDTLLSRINLILENEKETQSRIYNILMLLLTFSEKNPGITRILTGDALQGEQERLRERVQGLFEKLETQFKQVLRERKLREGKTFASDEAALANFFLAYVEGKMNQFVRSDFKAKPAANFASHWQELQRIWLA